MIHLLGWHISAFRQTDGGSSPARADSAQGARVAVWQTGLGGLKWIDELVQAGHAILRSGGGYPTRYTARGEHLIPRIVGGPPEATATWGCGPDDVVTSQWAGGTVIDRAAIDDCRSDEWLLIVVWDES